MSFEIYEIELVSKTSQNRTTTAHVYDNGDVLLHTKGGLYEQHFVSLTKEEILKLGKQKEVEALNERISRIRSETSKSFPVNTKFESIPDEYLPLEGWGRNVAEGVRYWYRTEKLSRNADISHKIGEFGRIA